MEHGDRRRRRKSGTLYGAVVIALIIIAALFGVGVFFKVSDIQVTGASMYDDEQVIQMSGVEIGDSIFFVSESSAALKIMESMPYIAQVRLVKTLPGTVTIEVTESYPLASFNSGGSWWIIDKNGKILEQTTADGASGTINIRGLEPIMPTVGQPLALGDDERVKLAYLKSLLSAILSYGYQGGITQIDISIISDIKFDYYGYDVVLGGGENIEDKFWLMSKVLEEHGTEGTGTIDLSSENKASYFQG